MHTTATTKGQIVIPAEIRKSLGIQKGTRIQVEYNKENGTILLRPITAAHVRRLRGSIKGLDLLGELERERETDRSREDRT
jgi:AbrB family looped-hinge helix DNA binding protein